jgi:hypothetical protein
LQAQCGSKCAFHLCIVVKCAVTGSLLICTLSLIVDSLVVRSVEWGMGMICARWLVIVMSSRVICILRTLWTNILIGGVRVLVVDGLPCSMHSWSL